MRGSKNDFEIKIRESVTRALIDMDGDSCHHNHNACKKFTKIFGKYLEQLYQDICNDFTWSEVIRVILEDICECLSVTYRRWMFVECIEMVVGLWQTLSTIYMFCVYDIFCFSFLREEDKKLYNSMLNTIYSHHKLSDGALELRKKR